MKKFFIIIATAALVMASGSAAFAKSAKMKTSSTSSESSPFEADFSLVAATGPASGFDFNPLAGFNIGAGMMIPNVPNLQGRFDLSYVSWDQTVYGVDVTYTRVPLLFSARYYFPVQSNLKFYAQAGLEVSFDTVDATTIVGVNGFGQPIYGKVSASETNIGFTPAGGVDFAINSKLSVIGELRIHTVSDSYVSFQGGVAYKF